MNSTDAGLKLYPGEFELQMKLSGRSWSKVQTFDEFERNMCRHKDQRTHQSKKIVITEA